MISPETGVPSFAALVTGVVAAVIGFVLDIDTLTTMISIGALLAFAGAKQTQSSSTYLIKH